MRVLDQNCSNGHKKSGETEWFARILRSLAVPSASCPGPKWRAVPEYWTEQVANVLDKTHPAPDVLSSRLSAYGRWLTLTMIFPTGPKTEDHIWPFPAVVLAGGGCGRRGWSAPTGGLRGVRPRNSRRKSVQEKENWWLFLSPEASDVQRGAGCYFILYFVNNIFGLKINNATSLPPFTCDQDGSAIRILVTAGTAGSYQT